MTGREKSYYRIYKALKEKLKETSPSEDQKLPSESELMKEYGATRYAVRKALSLLEEDHILYSHQGKGYFVYSCSTSSPGYDPSAPKRQILMIASRAERFYFIKVINGIQRALDNTGYSITIKLSNYDTQVEADLLREAIDQRSYDGIFLFPSNSGCIYSNYYLYRYLADHHIPAIALGNVLSFVDLPSVSSDDFEGGRIAGEYLVRKGHRNVACIMNREEYSGCMRYAGFEAGVRFSSAKNPVIHAIWFGHEDNETLFSVIGNKQILDLARSVTAFFCFNDSTALLLYDLLKSNGYSVPDDISIIGYDDSYLCRTGDLSLTSLHQDPDEMGFCAAGRLLRMIRDPSFREGKLFVPYLVERASVKDLSDPGGGESA